MVECNDTLYLITLRKHLYSSHTYMKIFFKEVWLTTQYKHFEINQLNGLGKVTMKIESQMG